MFLRTRRLFLRPIWPEDWRLLTQALGAQGMAEMRASLNWHGGAGEDGIPGRMLARRLLVTYPAAPGAPPVGALSIVRRGFRLVPKIWIARTYRGLGFAREVERGAEEMVAVLDPPCISAGEPGGAEIGGDGLDAQVVDREAEFGVGHAPPVRV